jgi:chaperonin cofactor prefoldin
MSLQEQIELLLAQLDQLESQLGLLNFVNEEIYRIKERTRCSILNR